MSDPSDGLARPEDCRYFYISYLLGPMVPGNIILRQIKSIEPEDHGLNIAGATEFLIERYQTPVIIISWSETTFKRYEQWKLCVQKIYRNMGVNAPTQLGVVQGGGESTKPNDGVLLSVVPKEKPPTP